jgi:hypothetical protein
MIQAQHYVIRYDNKNQGFTILSITQSYQMIVALVM